jgi:hypothetical protein
MHKEKKEVAEEVSTACGVTTNATASVRLVAFKPCFSAVL